MSALKPTARRWTSGEENQLREMLEAGKVADEIADALNRTPYSIYVRMQRNYRKRPVRDITRAVGWRTK
jgi:DNA-binding CsgD family transcriptional regulator